MRNYFVAFIYDIGRYRDWSVPLIYVLTQNKKQSTYEEIFEKLLELEPTIKPERVTVDFELAAINAVKKLFVGASVHGCFFHLGQNFWKKIQEVGLQLRYGNDASFARNLRMILALAFLPRNKVISAYEILVVTPFFADDEHNDANTEKQQLLNYFETYYIGEPGRTQKCRKTPRFPISIWNLYDITLEGKN